MILRPLTSLPALRAATLLGVALPLLGLGAWMGLRSGPQDAPAAPAPVIWLSTLAPDAAPRIADSAPGLHPRGWAVPAAHPAPEAPDLTARLDDDPAPRAARPVAMPAPGEPLAFVPAPPPRPARRGTPAPAPAPAATDLATRLALPEGGTAAIDLALGPQAQTQRRGLDRSPVPPRRPRASALQPDTGPAELVLAALTVPARLDAPPPRPRVARLAAPAPAAEPPAPALPVPELTARSGAEGCGPALARSIPRRPSRAAGGRDVAASVNGMHGRNRDAVLIRAIEGGNIPEHLRALVPVTMSGTGPDGRRARITICVTPDYLAVGSDRDFVRTPMGLPAANRLAERFDMLLPTAEMVDAIHAQARVRLAPSPMTPGAQMESTAYFVTHNNTVEAQRRATGAALGVLVSGHKKDVVLTNRLTRVAGRVAIYGWHRGNGRPIQPLSTVHGQHYADYSHGIRLVSRTAFVNGRAVDLADLLSDRRYAGILAGGEGPLATRQILASLR